MALDLTKYGTITTPEQKKTSTLDLSKYGAKPLDTAPVNKPPIPSLFGNPIQDIKNAGTRVNQAITGQGEFTGQNPLERGTAAAAESAMTIPTVIADVVPGGKQALDVLGKTFDSAVRFFGSVPSTLADVAEKAGVMKPEQRKLYDERNADFARSPEAAAIESVARVSKNIGDVANIILMADGFARGTQDLIDNKIPKLQSKMREEGNAKIIEETNAKQTKLINDTADEIAAVENKYAKGRNANLYSKDAGMDSRQRLAQSGVLKYSVNEDGLVQTKQPGGAVEQYKAMTIDPAEGVVRNNLEREGSKVNLSVVQSVLENKIKTSGLQGADLLNALNNVKKEIAGLRTQADPLGYVPTTLLHDAKINTTSNINYFTAPEISKTRKAIASGYKTLVEDNSSFNVKQVNAELAKYYEDIARLERLDGARVTGGRLGKYTAQISGNIIGGFFGGAIGGTVGAGLGTIVGGEISSALKGKSMSKTFSDSGSGVPKNEILNQAVKQGKSPRLMLPEGNKSGFRSQIPSGKTINLPERGQTTADTAGQTAAQQKKKILDFIESLKQNPEEALRLMEQNVIITPKPK